MIDGRPEAQAARARIGAVRCAAHIEMQLGEGALWLAHDIFGGAAFWCVDITGRRIWRIEPADGATRFWDAPDMPGFVAALPDGRFVAGLPDGLYRFDPRDGSFVLLAPVEADRPGNRLNDGYVDAEGRLWFGSMNLAETHPSGALYAASGFAATPEIVRADDGYVVTNGPAVSPDGRTLYHADSANQVIFAFDRGANGTLGGKRVFATLAQGYPDGLAVDAEGHVWVGVWAGARVLRLSPGGVLSGAMAFPCDNVTKLAFGGPELRTAYVTTARKGLSDAELGAQPLAGSVFSFPLEVAGLAQHRLR